MVTGDDYLGKTFITASFAYQYDLTDFDGCEELEDED